MIKAIVGKLPQESFIHQYICWAETLDPAPLAFHLGTALAILAATAPQSYQVENIFRGATISSLFVVNIGGTGSGKSSAIKLGQSLLMAASPDIFGYDPTSEEALLKNLADKPSQIIVNDDWGSTFLATTRNPQSYKAPLRGALTAFFDGGEMVKRKDAKGKEYPVWRPRLTMLLGATPSHLMINTVEEDWSGGYLNRHLFMLGESQRSFVRPQPDDLRQSRYDYMLGILRHAIGKRDNAECVGVDQMALDMLDTWLANDAARRKMLQGRRSDAVQRVPMIMSRVATLLGWDFGGARGEHPWLMSPSIIEFATTIADLCYMNVLAIIETIASSIDIRDMHKVFEELDTVEWRPAGALIERTGFLLRRLGQLLDAGVATGKVVSMSEGAVMYYRYNPDGEPTSVDPALANGAPAPTLVVVGGKASYVMNTEDASEASYSPHADGASPTQPHTLHLVTPVTPEPTSGSSGYASGPSLPESPAIPVATPPVANAPDVSTELRPRAWYDDYAD